MSIIFPVLCRAYNSFHSFPGLSVSLFDSNSNMKEYAYYTKNVTFSGIGSYGFGNTPAFYWFDYKTGEASLYTECSVTDSVCDTKNLT